MTTGNLHPLAQDYLQWLQRAGRWLPPPRLRELSAEIEGYLCEAIPAGASDHEALEVLERPVGGFAFGVGWLVGLILLWSSRLWTTRDKLVGTLIVPGGIATALLVVVLTGTTRVCKGFATPVNPSSGGLVGGASTHCTPSGGPSPATTALQIALVVFFVVGPVVSAVYRAAAPAPLPA